MCDGIADELQGIDLGDVRLNKRSKQVIEALAANPEASINASCEGWNDTLAAYRFFDNDAVSPEQILQPHLEATQRRMREQPVVLIAQDTTELDYTQHPPKDARCLNVEGRFGLFEHVHLAVTPDKLCLGVVGSESFDRACGESRPSEGTQDFAHRRERKFSLAGRISTGVSVGGGMSRYADRQRGRLRGRHL